MVDYVKLDDDEDKKNRKRKRYGFSFRNIILIAIFFFLLSSVISAITYSMTPKIAIVPIKEVIMTENSDSLFSDSSISSREISTIIRGLAEDTSVKAAIIDINSPGGSPVASQEIANSILELKTHIPVYILVNDMAASGGYWISVAGDKIYASDMSIVGSIGVTSATLGFEDFIKQYNITYRRQVAGKYKDIGSPFREPTEEEEKILQDILNEVHKNFITHVAKNRNMSYEEVEKYATGEIFLGSKAKEIGFIDEIGFLPDVISDLQNITNSQSAISVEYAPEQSIFQELGLSTKVESLQESKILLR